MKKSVLRIAAVGAVTALVAAIAPMTAHAATTPTYDTTTDAPIYLMDNTTAEGIPAGTQLDWNTSNGVVLTANPVPSDLGDLSWATLAAPTGSANTFITFLATPGTERSPKTWKAYGDAVALNGQGALLPALWPGHFLYGTSSAVKAAGGTYSMGIAYTDSAIVASTNVVKAYYTTINVDAGTGTWTFATPAPSVTKTDTTTTLSASDATVLSGASVTLTATVAPSAATGNVTFMDGTSSLGIAASANGVATLTTSTLAKGSHSITAVYGGNSDYNKSTSAAQTVTVVDATAPVESTLVDGNKNGVSTTVNANVGTLTVQVGAALNGKTVNVYGYSDPVLLGQQVVSGGSVTVPTSALAGGDHLVAVTDATNGTLVGWAAFTLAANVTGSPATRHLEAAVATSVDGEFTLVAPDDSTPALINNPKLDTNSQSVSTGTLGKFSVVDDRSISKRGWDLTASVDKFTNGTNTVDNSALGMKPQMTSNSGPGLPTMGAEQVAGSAVYAAKFAELSSGSYSTLTDLNADLAFKAPLGTKAGTYTSTLTLTLVSK